MSSDGSTVLFGALPSKVQFPASDRRRLARFTRKLSAQVARGKHFECFIADDRELHRLNSIFLGHDYPTDVLSFPSANKAFTLGEIAISAERADEQAHRFGHKLVDEIEILMLHGVLHLLGLDHEKDAGEMARVETKWRTDFRLPQSLIARSEAQETTLAGAD